MHNSDLKLIALFTIIAASIILRVSVESTSYRTPDSLYYLEVSQNILDGRGFYRSNVFPIPEIKTPNNLVYFAIWPLGYPLLIVATSYLTNLEPLWASKLVNIIFMGLCFLIFRQVSYKRGYFLGLIFCSFTLLEVFSYTWSEAPFNFFLLWLTYSLFKYFEKGALNKYKYIYHAIVASTCLFFIRYIGIFSFFILLGIVIYLLIKKQYRESISWIIPGLVSIIIVSLYLYHNYLQTGYITGGERLFPTREGTILFLWLLLKGLLTEFFIIRKFYFEGIPDLFTIIIFLFQVVLLSFVFIKYIKPKTLHYQSGDRFALISILLGLTYTFFLIIIRRISPFDPFDYRLLSPLTFSLSTAVMSFLINPFRAELFQQIEKYFIFLFILSLLLNLPKHFLYKSILGIL